MVFTQGMIKENDELRDENVNFFGYFLTKKFVKELLEVKIQK